ncbi:unnamed protein product [Somion occarium]|uniref:Domain of unknown function at the cortex 1 domain-containing protein n=1 Tax=Somion occarium TaxID=3059160 RepID=A0ABP1CVE4_9APHY
MPRLRVLAGPSLEELVPIEVNSDKAFDIKSDAFEGQAAVYIKGFADPNGDVGDSSYFSQEGRTDVTWSIQVQGRFLQPHSANDVMFGNTFDRPLQLPWGFSAVLGFMQYIDPTLEQDLASQTKPWALSPLIATMPYFAHTRMDELHKVPPFPPIKPIEEDISELRVKSESGEESVLDPATGRKTYFRSVENRQRVIFGPETFATTISISARTVSCYVYLEASPST